MTAISLSTQRRLQQLPQIPSVWEGDRRHVDRLVEELELDNTEDRRELIVWVDGVEGVVRSMEVVNPAMGAEAVVRALLKAMEAPQAPSQPARPQKIIVRDRQLQFYLRGVLQDLEIAIEYAPDLPIIDELFHRFADLAGVRTPKLQRKYLDSLKQTAREIWDLAPWSMLADYEAISIELNAWDIEKFYVSVMGMLGMEYGILLYRSAESLQRFRAMALNEDGIQDMESAFLSQDCIFVTFDAIASDITTDLGSLPASEIEPNFGNIHPMEGMRPFLYEAEAISAQVALVALKEFVSAFEQQLQADDLPALSKRVSVKAPDIETWIEIAVETMPELSQELLQMHMSIDAEEMEFDPMELPIREDLIPEDAAIGLEILSWERVEKIRLADIYHQTSEVKAVGAGLPAIVIQTTRPRAKEMLQRIQQAGGLQGICFNPGENLQAGSSFDLGILQLADGEMQVFGEFQHDSPHYVADRQQWNQGSKKTKGYCGLVIAQGLTGKARGNPGVRETLALLETKYLSTEELGLGTLQLMPHFD